MRLTQLALCEEKYRLLRDFLQTIHELNSIQGEQTKAIIEGEPDFCRFEALIHLAQQKKESAKYAWIAHVEADHCHDGK